MSKIVEKCCHMGDAVNVRLILKGGEDGMGGLSKYDQRLDLNLDASNLFVVTCAVLAMICDDGTSIYTNDSPNSPLSVFAQKMIVMKETEKLIKEEYEKIIEELKELDLEPIEISSGKKL
jgi:hypothetical protein